MRRCPYLVLFMSALSAFCGSALLAQQASPVSPGMGIPAASKPGQNIIRNPGMTEMGMNGLPSDWSDFSWGQSERTFSRETESGGNAFARLAVNSIGMGQARIKQGLVLAPGKTYRASVRLKSDKPDLRMQWSVVNMEAPYLNFFSQDLIVEDQWKTYVCIFDCTKAYDKLVLFIGTMIPSVFDVDDVSLVEIDPEAEDQGAPVFTGNLIVGGSFEGGMDYHWGSRHRANRYAWETVYRRDYRYELELIHKPPRIERVAGGAHGTYALSVELPPRTTCHIRSCFFTANYGRTHRLSLFAKKIGGPVRLDYGLGSDKNEFAIKNMVTPTEEWTQYSTNGKVKVNINSRYFFSLDLVAKESAATVFLDGISMVEGAGTPSTERYPAELYFRSKKAGNIFFTSETPSADVAIFATGAPLPSGTLEITITDIFGKSVALPPRPVAGARRELEVPLSLGTRPSASGIFKANVTYRSADGSPLAAPGAYIFTLIPDLNSKTNHDMPFGIHADAYPGDLEILWKLGFRWLRLLGPRDAVDWHVVETNRGVFSFCDGVVTRAREKGFHLLGTLWNTPRWASLGGDSNYNYIPVKTEDFRNYAATTMARYRDVIDYYEVYNEPVYDWLKYTNADYYVTLLGIARAEAKKNNARTIGVCTIAPDRIWPSAVFAAGGLNLYDLFSFHGYIQQIVGGESDQLSDAVDYFHRAAASNRGELGTVWDTEGSSRWYGSWYDGLQLEKPLLSHAYNLKHLIAAYAMRQVLGVEKFFLYTASVGQFVVKEEEYKFGLLEGDRSAPKPPLAAIPFFFDFIYGYTVGSTVLRGNIRLVEYKPFSPGKYRTVAWNLLDAAETLKLPSAAKAQDVMGNPQGKSSEVTLGKFPLFLESDDSIVGSYRTPGH